MNLDAFENSDKLDGERKKFVRKSKKKITVKASKTDGGGILNLIYKNHVFEEAGTSDNLDKKDLVVKGGGKSSLIRKKTIQELIKEEGDEFVNETCPLCSLGFDTFAN